jgi:hypothetical protein
MQQTALMQRSTNLCPKIPSWKTQFISFTEHIVNEQSGQGHTCKEKFQAIESLFKVSEANPHIWKWPLQEWTE